MENSDGQNNPQKQNDSDLTSNDNALIITNNNPEESSGHTEVSNMMRGMPGGSSLESEEATSSSEAVTSASSTEVESLAASLIRAQEEHTRAEAGKATQAHEGKMEVRRSNSVLIVLDPQGRNTANMIGRIFRMNHATRKLTKTSTMLSGLGEFKNRSETF